MNRDLQDRIEAIQSILVAGYRGGSPVSSATKGVEREFFVAEFLSRMLPPAYRFGDGDIIDRLGHRSGQIDVVIEPPTFPSFPVLPGSSSRLYLAEGVACAIEVKSDLEAQWPQVVSKAAQVDSLRPAESPMRDRVPLLVVGYTGWKTLETTEEHVAAIPALTGVLVIDTGFFVARIPRRGTNQKLRTSGPNGLFTFVGLLSWILTTSAPGISIFAYADDYPPRD